MFLEEFMRSKNFRSRVAGGALSAALFFSAGSWAQTANDDFQQGMDAAAAGKYDQAVTYFLRAKKAGSKRPALDYNLGVAYFKLGKYEPAREAFLRLTGEPGFEQLAYYNLGLTANKAEDEKAAVAWFQRAYAGGNDANIRTLSAQALQRLGAKPRKTAASSKQPWSGFVATLLGHDSNVTLVNDDLTAPPRESDNTFEVLAAADRWLQGGPKDGLQLSLSADAQMYAKNSQYDFSLLHAGVLRYGRLQGWQTDFGMSWDEIYFDGRKYQRVINAEAQGRYPLSKGKQTGDKQLRLRYRLSRIQATDGLYDYLDGWRQQWRAGVWARDGERRYKVYYQLEVNDRDDFTNVAGGFTSFSPTRHTLLMAASMPVAPRWSAGADVRYRYSVYNDANDLTGGVQKTRADNQYRLGTQLTYALAKNWEFEAGYGYTNNDSNIAGYTYRRSLVTAGVNWFF
jgi:tetratricopeptide (TPR) repeat protein